MIFFKINSLHTIISIILEIKSHEITVFQIILQHAKFTDIKNSNIFIETIMTIFRGSIGQILIRYVCPIV